MLPDLSLLEKQISRADQQLLYYLILETRETNRLLRKLAGEESHEQSDDIDNMKRQDLMKRMAQLKDKPAGWNKWETEDIRRHLKGVAS